VHRACILAAKNRRLREPLLPNYFVFQEIARRPGERFLERGAPYILPPSLSRASIHRELTELVNAEFKKWVTHAKREGAIKTRCARRSLSLSLCLCRLSPRTAAEIKLPLPSSRKRQSIAEPDVKRRRAAAGSNNL